MARGFYYGWVHLAVAAAAMVATLPGRTQGLGLITEPLLADLGVDRVTYASINLWATLIGALFCIPCGRLTDRLGARCVVAGLLALLGATVLVMAQVSGWLGLAVTITLTRGFGQSALSVVSIALAGKWFARRLNLAMGIYALLVGIGFIAAFPIVGQAVLGAGWRAAWTGVGAALLFVLSPLSWILVRGNPGETANDVEQLSAEPGDLTMAEALASPAFWFFAGSSALFGLAYSGIALFNQSILELRGFGAETYHRALVLSTMLGLAANFAGGWAATRWPVQRLAGIGMAVLALALAVLPLVRDAWHVDAYAAAMGVSGGIVTVVFFSVWGQVFGRAHLGRIQGCAQTLTVVASAVGPLLLAEALARTGSYDAMFRGLAIAVVAVGLGAWLAPLPQRRQREAHALRLGYTE